MRYRFIEEQNDSYEVTEMCESLQVSSSGYYRWQEGRPSPRKRRDDELKLLIVEIHRKAKGRYGHRPIYHHLDEDGHDCGRDRTLRLMKELCIEGSQKKRYRPLGGSDDPGFGYSPNLFKQLGSPNRLNEVWVADTTYLATQGAWMYLATVMDLYSRRIIGWSLSWCNNAELICHAMRNAVNTRGDIPKGIIAHSDRGSTYSSFAYQQLLESYGMEQSMSAKGNCYDNAAMESFYGRYKSSSVRGLGFVNETQARKNVFEYIEVFYNRYRKHASLGYKNPVKFEQSAPPPMGGTCHLSCNTLN